MGWTMFEVDPGKKTVDVLREELDQLEFLVVSEQPGVFYAAVKHRKHPEERVFGLVVLVKRDTAGFAFKVMDEAMGPYDCDAGREVLEALGPLDDVSPSEAAWSREWRKRAWKLVLDKEEACT